MSTMMCWSPGAAQERASGCHLCNGSILCQLACIDLDAALAGQALADGEGSPPLGEARALPARCLHGSSAVQMRAACRLLALTGQHLWNSLQRSLSVLSPVVCVSPSQPSRGSRPCRISAPCSACMRCSLCCRLGTHPHLIDLDTAQDALGGQHLHKACACCGLQQRLLEEDDACVTRVVTSCPVPPPRDIGAESTPATAAGSDARTNSSL